MSSATDTDADLAAEAVAELLADRSTREVVAEAERTGWATDLWGALADGGYPWISVSEAAGGVGGGVAEACAVLELLGRYAAPVPVAETGLLGGWLLARAGLDVPAGPVSVAPRHDLVGHDAGGRLSITGTMRRVAWGRHATVVVALVRRPDAGPLVVAVAPDRATVTHGTNLAGEPRDDLHVTDLVLTDHASAPAPDGVDDDELLRRGALSRACLIAGAARRAVTLTVGYATEREQFGRPLARFQAVAGQLAQLAEQAEAAGIAARAAAASATEDGLVDLDVAAAKAVASEAAGRVAALAHQVTGAMGMTQEYELGLLTRRLWSWRDEYGPERWWNTRLGAGLCARGADALWPALAGGPGAGGPGTGP